MNSIPTIQNNLQQLRKLLVEDRLYSKAKTCNGIQIILVVFVSAALSLVAVICETWGPRAALYGAIITILDFYLFDPIIAQLKGRAASVRECFDIDVLILPQSPFREANIPIEDIVAIPDPLPEARKRNKIDWYPKIIHEIPIEPARLICQRSSMQYDERLRNSFTYLWITLVAVIVFAWTVWLAIKNPDFYHIATVTSAILPAFLFCVKQNILNKEACTTIAKMRVYFDEVWKECLSNSNSMRLTESSRQIQDALFDHRSQRPLVPNFYYKLTRDQNEQIMDSAAEDYVIRYKQAHNII
ncbi:F0F1-type ATP synthase assembly protein I [Hymenobacter luteus]|uniref:F0F1-type ATP synthase assembly protein I n=2 Tax=Hymenobacter TaxID=89966 RepID=A0A7W9WE92_9BACT|nr:MULTISPECIES: S-4TM family putative pore-forming effector [Hymenobacter]MBB4603592.1 F0F1-type ATP synthase assembly protein I [Hymenobacter latericoloratus]MBB6061340.1 F0F1-type ATP synthase assembly protein I [Hymenobacter luteus]